MCCPEKDAAGQIAKLAETSTPTSSTGTLNSDALLGKQCICSHKYSKLAPALSIGSQFLLVRVAPQTLWTTPYQGWLHLWFLTANA